MADGIEVREISVEEAVATHGEFRDMLAVRGATDPTLPAGWVDDRPQLHRGRPSMYNPPR